MGVRCLCQDTHRGVHGDRGVLASEVVVEPVTGCVGTTSDGLRGYVVCVMRFAVGCQDKWCKANFTRYVVRSRTESQLDTGNI